jgi:threonine dehydrogenase-like Zn-dependent dehydrogenase
MRAVVADFGLAKAAITLALSKISKSAFYGPFSILSFYSDYPEPKLPGERWVKIKTTLSGICGSDLRLIMLEESFYLYPLTSFPLILGHEVVGRVEEVGKGVDGIEEGERVVIDNVLPCKVRGLEECPACREGRYSICYNFDRGAISPGIFTGYCRDTGGGWSDYFVAHQHQLIKVPDGLSDEKAVFAEPFAICLHAVLKSFPKEDDIVAIIGCGMMGIGIAAALRALGFRGEIVGIDVSKFQTEMAKKFGVGKTICLERGERAIEGVAEFTGARVYYPPREKPMFVGRGVDIVFECVGKSQTVDDSLRIVRPGGKVILLGTAGKLAGVDFAPVFSKEIEIKGVFGSGLEKINGKRRAFELAIELFQKEVDLSPLLTHKFPIEKYKEALWTAMNKNKSKAVKVAFSFEN